MSDHIPVLSALRAIGVELPSTVNGPVQFKCPFHSGGNEHHPSARLYPADDSIYCFTCHKSWDGLGVYATHWGVSRGLAAGRLGVSHRVRHLHQPTLDDELSTLLRAIRHLPEPERTVAWKLVDTQVLEPAIRGVEALPACLEVERRLFAKYV